MSDLCAMFYSRDIYYTRKQGSRKLVIYSIIMDQYNFDGSWSKSAQLTAVWLHFAGGSECAAYDVIVNAKFLETVQVHVHVRLSCSDVYTNLC